MTGREVFDKFEVILNYFTYILSKCNKKVPYSILNMVYSKRGKIAIGIRYICIKSLAIKCGKNIRVNSNVVLRNIENMEFGDNISIHEFCYIDGHGGIKIGNDVSVAHSSSILSSNHGIKLSDIPIKYQNMELKKVIIENNVWIGSGVRILGGNVIEEGCVLGAGTILTKSTHKNCIYVGVSAKCLKKRI